MFDIVIFLLLIIAFINSISRKYYWWATLGFILFIFASVAWYSDNYLAKDVAVPIRIKQFPWEK